MNTTITDAITGHRDAVAARDGLRRTLQGAAQPAARDALTRALDALSTDPTLALTLDGQRRIDLIAEMGRQLKPLGRQAAAGRAHSRIHADPALTGPERDAAQNRLGKINPAALAEEDRILARLDDEVAQLTAAARADWRDPAHLAEIARRLLPSPLALADIAAQVRRAVGSAAAVAPYEPEVRRLLDLADALDGGER